MNHFRTRSRARLQQRERRSLVVFLGAGLAEVEVFSLSVWKEQMEHYVEDIGEIGETEIEVFYLAVDKVTMNEDDADSYGDEDDKFEEVCSLRFDLAYGGKIMLRESKLPLL